MSSIMWIDALETVVAHFTVEDYHTVVVDA